ncbi:MAG: hypothetical protein JXR58_10415 [Bacteroidales bacterium]|nr:hypothetical protein [Bacteroidales bacterium]
MIRKIRFILILISLQSFAQQDSTKSVLLVTYHPDLYYNAISEKLCVENGKTYPQLSNSIRLNLDSVFSKNLNAFSLLRSFTGQSSSPIEEIYNNVSYEHKTAPDFDYKKYAGLKKSKISLSKKKEKKAKKGIYNGEISSPVVENYDKYLHSEVKDKELIKRILSEYKSDILVFISQLEINTDYINSDPLSEKGYDVFFKVHYNIFSSDGKHSFGSFAIIQMQVEEVSLTIINNKVFPELVNTISAKF